VQVQPCIIQQLYLCPRVGSSPCTGSFLFGPAAVPVSLCCGLPCTGPFLFGPAAVLVSSCWRPTLYRSSPVFSPTAVPVSSCCRPTLYRSNPVWSSSCTCVLVLASYLVQVHSCLVQQLYLCPCVGVLPCTGPFLFGPAAVLVSFCWPPTLCRFSPFIVQQLFLCPCVGGLPCEDPALYSPTAVSVSSCWRPTL
jgi:hypothetical protein